MPDQTPKEMNRWAAEFLDRWWTYPDEETGETIRVAPDCVHELSACKPLLMKMGKRGRFYWDEEKECWVYDLVVDDGSHWHFCSSEPSPGSCIVLAARHAFPEGKESDA